MIIHNCQQRSDEWRRIRLGHITSTNFATMANGKKDTIETLCYKIASEKLTGQSAEENYTNPAIEHGIETEDEAIGFYETEYWVHVQKVGFVELDDFIGVSPDGLIGEDGGVEVKCPQTHTHLKYLKNPESLYKDYKWQVQGCLWVTSRKWWDIISYCNSFTENRMVRQRILPSDECIDALKAGADKCRKRIQEILNGNNDA